MDQPINRCASVMVTGRVTKASPVWIVTIEAIKGASPPRKHTGFTHIALEIDDIEAVQQQLAARGITITETVELPDGTVFFFVRDPDGNVIEFHKPA